MKILVLYDSVYGNTEKIAKALADSITSGNDIKTFHVGEFNPDHLAGLEVLIVGTPTQKFSPLKTVNEFIDRIPPGGLKGIKVAAFDTRISSDDVKNRSLKFMIKLFGYAAGPVLKKLESKGGKMITPVEGFIVNNTQGPLKEGEIERAAEWGRSIGKLLIQS
jgi:flavodoxin